MTERGSRKRHSDSAHFIIIITTVRSCIAVCDEVRLWSGLTRWSDQVIRLQHCTATIACLGTELIFPHDYQSPLRCRSCVTAQIEKPPCGARELWVLWAAPMPAARHTRAVLGLVPSWPSPNGCFLFPSTAHGQNPSSYRALMFLEENG